jgi:hypothetical protein
MMHLEFVPPVKNDGVKAVGRGSAPVNLPCFMTVSQTGGPDALS